jgi:hypothetical protein
VIYSLAEFKQVSPALLTCAIKCCGERPASLSLDGTHWTRRGQRMNSRLDLGRAAAQLPEATRT